MPEGFDILTEKEKETLRLLVRGYDAKTIARHFELSVHTVNERLKNARRKLSVSSSREAARLLFDEEGDAPKNLMGKQLGEAVQADSGNHCQVSSNPEFEDADVLRKSALLIGGIVIMFLAIAIFLVSPSVLSISEEVSKESRTPDVVAADTRAETAAGKWLALVDASDWQGSYNAAGQSFKKLNTVESWQSASRQARVPLGAALQRRAISFQNVAAPPQGYTLVRFRTNFSNKAGAIETVTLERQNGRFKVVGYVID